MSRKTSTGRAARAMRFIPSLSALVSFEAAATYHSFTKAGENLGLTQSELSRQVNGLEKRLGVKLFERIGPQFVLMDARRSYVPTITALLELLEGDSLFMPFGAPVVSEQSYFVV